MTYYILLGCAEDKKGYQIKLILLGSGWLIWPCFYLLIWRFSCILLTKKAKELNFVFNKNPKPNAKMSIAYKSFGTTGPFWVFRPLFIWGGQNLDHTPNWLLYYEISKMVLHVDNDYKSLYSKLSIQSWILWPSKCKLMCLNLLFKIWSDLRYLWIYNSKPNKF